MPPSVSLVIVSRERPAALALCLTGVAQLDYPLLEVIVVACPAGVDVVAARADAARIKVAPYDAANISAARNLGIALAAGDIVAFLDDDAVPEPSWLRHLAASFEDAQVAVAGGFVRGRNGISYQNRARVVDALGNAEPLEIVGDAPVVLRRETGRAIKTEGTNMAVRRELLVAMGGFDPAFRFYLDETDLNMRLAMAGHATAIVPLAEVHHGYAASARRHADRRPRDLFEIGASLAVYLRKHAPEARHKAQWLRFQAEQRARLAGFLQQGPMGADDVARLMHGLRKGWKAGQARALEAEAPLLSATEAFRPFAARPGAPHLVLSGRTWQRESLHQAARAAVRDGAVVTVFRFSPTALFHRMRFHADGFWEQTGGQFGRSDRDQPALRMATLRRRVRAETARLSRVRPV